MALWLVRAGKHGEHEQRFLQNDRVYATWSGLTQDLGKARDRQEVRKILQAVYPEDSKKAAINYSGQLWAFAHEMRLNDWIVLPLKTKPAIALCEVTGPYEFDPRANDPYFHSRKVRWVATDVPRSVFDQDLLYSFGAFMTVCEISRNDAENRVRTMAKAGWKSVAVTASTLHAPGHDEAAAFSGEAVDLERLARDQIAKMIVQRFTGHGLARLVGAILKAQQYTIYLSPEGPDKGVDILAAPGPLGFGRPRICVQVKSGDTPVDRSTLNELVGTMQNVKADQGLLVSWGGFKSSVDRETAQQFFSVRLWDQDALIDELLAHYDSLDEDLRAEIPLKRVWTRADQAGEE